jgi:hypothetical protein
MHKTHDELESRKTGDNAAYRCGCGHEVHSRQRHHGMRSGWHHHDGCSCMCHDYHHGEEMFRGYQCRCGCGQHGHHSSWGFRRHFISQDEVIAGLEEYLKELQAEANGVKERIMELKKEEESKQK